MYKDFVKDFMKARDIAPIPWMNEDRVRTAKLLSIFRKIRNKRVLDLGCEQGYFSKFLATNNSVYALDVEDKSRYFDGTKIKFFQHDANNPLPFQDSFFDVVVANETLEHIKNLDMALSEISRVMKKGGALICDVPATGLNFFIDAISLFYPLYAFIRRLFIDVDKLDSENIAVFIRGSYKKGRKEIAVFVRGSYKKGKLGLLKYPLLIENWFNMAYAGRKVHFHKHNYTWWKTKLEDKNFVVTDTTAAGFLFPVLSFLPESVQNKLLIIEFLAERSFIAKTSSFCVIFRAKKAV